jgi:hypothetical protein
MADDSGAPQLDLEQILKTLSSLQPLPPPAHQYQQQSYDVQPFPTGAGNAPQTFAPALPPIPYEQARSQDPRLVGRSIPQHRQPPPQNRTPTPTVDSSTILDWKQGVRWVNKISAQNPGFEASIQKVPTYILPRLASTDILLQLIKDQQRNVRDW